MPTLQRPGYSLHYGIEGNGPALLLLHSFLCSGAMWKEQVSTLAEQFRVITVDLRGHGESTGADQPLTLYDLVDDILALLDKEKIPAAIWAGLSIGGMIALRAALQAPERVTALVLMDTHAGPERPLKKIRYRAMVTAARIFGVKPLIPQVNQLMFGHNTLIQKEELVQEWAPRFAAVPISTISNTVAALCERDDLRPRLGDIRQPTLVIVGEEDKSLPPPYSIEIAKGIAQAQLRIISRAGHLSALEQPEAVTAQMSDFLAHLASVDGDSSPALTQATTGSTH